MREPSEGSPSYPFVYFPPYDFDFVLPFLPLLNATCLTQTVALPLHGLDPSKSLYRPTEPAALEGGANHERHPLLREDVCARHVRGSRHREQDRREMRDELLLDRGAEVGDVRWKRRV